MTALRAWFLVGAVALVIGGGFYVLEWLADQRQMWADARRYRDQRLRGERS